MGRDPAARMTPEVAQEVCQRLGLPAMLDESSQRRPRDRRGAAAPLAIGATIARRG